MQLLKYAVLGDIHANQEALESVLQDAAGIGVNKFLCVGDVVGYNANPSECLDKIRELGAVCVRGNHDHYCSHPESLDDFHPMAANVIDWTRRHLTADQVQFLKEMHLSRVVSGVTLVHSTLDMPDKWGYVFDTLEADANFNYQSTAICFHGHTHVPAMYIKQGRVTRSVLTKHKLVLGAKYFINVGSVGQPRDGDHRAAYLVYDVREKIIELRRVEYDIEKTKEKILKSGLPPRLAQRLGIGK